MKLGFVVAGCAALICAAPASAEVRDATYRGTLVCKRIAAIKADERGAIEVTVKNGAVTYAHKVGSDAAGETGDGALDGDKISLKGGFRAADKSYDANYSGTFVRRSAKLTGTQVWTIGGKTYTRDCSGSIKRPLAPFLPKDKKV